jgi:hypothetical protein
MVARKSSSTFLSQVFLQASAQYKAQQVVVAAPERRGANGVDAVA